VITRGAAGELFARPIQICWKETKKVSDAGQQRRNMFHQLPNYQKNSISKLAICPDEKRHP
jgi:hypothetical protein